MKKALLILALPLIQFAASSAQAAAHTAAPADPKTRAEVKSETQLSGGAAGAQKGEAAAAMAVDKKTMSTKSRSEVKAEAKGSVTKSEKQLSGGANDVQKSEAGAAMAADKPAMGTKARSDVKAEAKGTVTKSEKQLSGGANDMQKSEAGAAMAVAKPAMGTKARSDVKAEAKATNQADMNRTGDNMKTGK